MAQAPPRSLGRISEIAQVAVRHGFGYFFHRNRLTDLVGEDGQVVGEAPSERGRHLRELLDELGPTFVKFGQLLSMRPDVLPPDIIAELRALQDDVSPFPYEEAAQVVEADLGQPIERLFREFDPVPMAAASIGQVHNAVLPNGRRVAVKVQRPGAPRQIEADLNLMYQAARLAKERVRALDFIDARGLTDEDVSKATRLFIDVAHENVEALPRRLADLGVRYPKEREEEFVAELRELFYRYYGATLDEIDPQQVIREVFGVIYRLNLRLPTRFVLLDKAIATLGSVGVDLYPDFNVFEVARPYARSLMLERYTPGRVISRARRESWNLARIAAEVPYQVHDVLEQARDGQIEVGFVHKGLDEFMHRIDVVFNRLVVALVVTGGLIGSSLIGIFAEEGPHLFGVHFLSVLGFVLSGILGFWLLIGVIRGGRL